MKKKLTAVFIMLLFLPVFMSPIKSADKDTRDKYWRNYDLSRPNPDDIFENRDAALAAGGGWYYTINENFENYANIDEFLYDPVTNPDSIWTNSPHSLRWPPYVESSKNHSDWAEKNKSAANWWCPDMIELKDGKLIIKAEKHTKQNPHTCTKGICPKEGFFTSGIETRLIAENGSDQALFSQAFGYFECTVKLPDTNGMWSAFWLQSSNQRKIGNGGEDGTEIDIYESAFRKLNKFGSSMMGHALLWDGYSEYSKSESARFHLPNTNLYDGYHTFALKWTPFSYVFYIDGAATWATNAGGVSRVAEFLRFTCEINTGSEHGPHGMKIGKFAPKNGEDTNFYIDSVKVMQHTDFERHIMPDDYFIGEYDVRN